MALKDMSPVKHKVSEDGSVLCYCHELARRRHVTKDNQNKGRAFYACDRGEDTKCRFFLWEDTISPDTSPVKSDASTSVTTTKTPYRTAVTSPTKPKLKQTLISPLQKKSDAVKKPSLMQQSLFEGHKTATINPVSNTLAIGHRNELARKDTDETKSDKETNRINLKAHDEELWDDEDEIAMLEAFCGEMEKQNLEKEQIRKGTEKDKRKLRDTDLDGESERESKRLRQDNPQVDEDYGESLETTEIEEKSGDAQKLVWSIPSSSNDAESQSQVKKDGIFLASSSSSKQTRHDEALLPKFYDDPELSQRPKVIKRTAMRSARYSKGGGGSDVLFGSGDMDGSRETGIKSVSPSSHSYKSNNARSGVELQEEEGDIYGMLSKVRMNILRKDMEIEQLRNDLRESRMESEKLKKIIVQAGLTL